MIKQGIKNSNNKVGAFSLILGLYMLLALMVISSNYILAQNKKTDAGTGRPLSNLDSLNVKQLFFAALRDKTGDNPTSAASYFDKILQIDPNNDASLYELANIKKQQGNYDDARTLLEKAVTVDPDNKWYWIGLSECYEKNRDFPKLENVFSQLIRIEPDRPDFYFDQANAYFFDKKYDDALKAYDHVEEITGPTDDLLANRQKVYLKQGNVDLAAKQLEQMIALNPGEIKYYLFLAELYNANNFADKALKILQTAEKIDAGNGQVHLALADIYRDKKDNEASFNELTLAFAIPDIDIDQKIKIIFGYIPKFPEPNAKASALELSRIIVKAHPSESKAYAIYGDMLLQNDKPKDARDMYKKSIALNSQIYEVQEQLVRIELSENDIDDAIKDSENALSFFPNQAWMNYLAGISYFQKKNFNKAISYIKNATSLEFQDKDLLTQSFSALGDCYHDLKDFKNSDASYEKALNYNPDNAFTLNNYSYYLSLRGEQLERAAAMSKHSNELQPNNSSFEDTYAWILFKQKDYQGAKTWMEKAMADDKDKNATKLEHLGDIMFYLGNIDAAVENWKQARLKGGASAILDRKINEKKYIE